MLLTDYLIPLNDLAHTAGQCASTLIVDPWHMRGAQVMLSLPSTSSCSALPLTRCARCEATARLQAGQECKQPPLTPRVSISQAHAAECRSHSDALTRVGVHSAGTHSAAGVAVRLGGLQLLSCAPATVGALMRAADRIDLRHFVRRACCVHSPLAAAMSLTLSVRALAALGMSEASRARARLGEPEGRAAARRYAAPLPCARSRVDSR